MSLVLFVVLVFLSLTGGQGSSLFSTVLALFVLALLVDAFNLVRGVLRRVVTAGRRQDPSPPGPAKPPDAPPVLSREQEELRRATAAKMGRMQPAEPTRGRTLAEDGRTGRLLTDPRAATRTLETIPPPARSLEGRSLEAPAAGSVPPPTRALPETGRPLFGSSEETEVMRRARLAREDRAFRLEAVQRDEAAVKSAAAEARDAVKRGTVVPYGRDMVRAIIWAEVLGPPKSRRR